VDPISATCQRRYGDVWAVFFSTGKRFTVEASADEAGLAAARAAIRQHTAGAEIAVERVDTATGSIEWHGLRFEPLATTFGIDDPSPAQRDQLIACWEHYRTNLPPDMKIEPEPRLTRPRCRLSRTAPAPGISTCPADKSRRGSDGDDWCLIAKDRVAARVTVRMSQSNRIAAVSASARSRLPSVSNAAEATRHFSSGTDHGWNRCGSAATRPCAARPCDRPPPDNRRAR